MTAVLDREFRFAGSPVKYRAVALIVLGLPALAPLFFILRPVAERDGGVLSQLEADVLGTGSMALLLATLAITPAITLTGQAWIAPLRRWYGIVFGVTAVTDLVLAAISGPFTGGPPGRLFGHTFLAAGVVMVAIAIPLTLTAWRPGMRALGRYWVYLQRLTYAIWALLFVHLALLEGLGPQHGTNGPSPADDPLPYAVFHQRLYQLAAVSLILLVLRIPSVRRWTVAQRKAGRAWLLWLVFALPVALALFAYAFIVTELVFKGVAAWRLQPVGG